MVADLRQPDGAAPEVARDGRARSRGDTALDAYGTALDAGEGEGSGAGAGDEGEEPDGEVRRHEQLAEQVGRMRDGDAGEEQDERSPDGQVTARRRTASAPQQREGKRRQLDRDRPGTADKRSRPCRCRDMHAL